MNERTSLVICMGVSGVGKTTVAKALATTLGLQYIEADDFHPEANKARMAAGQALTDEDREPWMDAVCDALREAANNKTSCVMAHSALRRPHRDRLRHLGFYTLFLHLGATPQVIAERLSKRRGHYMSPDLLQSQFDALEDTAGEPDIHRLSVDADPDVVAASATQIVKNFLERRPVRDT